MTFSIVAWDEITGMTGVAVSTRFLAIGSLCPFARAGVGAIATQAFVNPTFGPRALQLLEQDVQAQDVLDILLKSDEGREHRQVHIVDRHGNTAACTGNETVAWSGHRTVPYLSVAGNMLVGEEPLTAMVQAYQAARDAPFSARLLDALEAAEAAGGDKRGCQSAALYTVSTEVYPYLDLRVDDHTEPVAELRRIYEEAKSEYIPFKQFLPTAANPAGVYQRDLVDQLLSRQSRHAAERKSRRGP